MRRDADQDRVPMCARLVKVGLIPLDWAKRKSRMISRVLLQKKINDLEHKIRYHESQYGDLSKWTASKLKVQVEKLKKQLEEDGSNKHTKRRSN